MKLRSSLFLGVAAFALLRCSIYDSDALGGADGTSSGGKTKSSAAGTGGDGGSGGDPTTTSDASSSSGSPDGSSTADTTTSATTDTTATTDTSSSSSDVVSSSSTGVVVVDVWINELHYDNNSADADEGVEVAGTAGADLTGWSLAAYNGSNGTLSMAGTMSLSGTLPNQMAGKGTKWFAFSGLENGPADGIALVDAGGAVVQLLSWEGTFTATAGPATGMMSVALPVSEEPAPAVGLTLQLTGAGDAYADFTWVAGVAASHDAINAGQTFQ